METQGLDGRSVYTETFRGPGGQWRCRALDCATGTEAVGKDRESALRALAEKLGVAYSPEQKPSPSLKEIERLAAQAGLRVERTERDFVISDGSWQQAYRSLREVEAYIRGYIRGRGRDLRD